MARDRDFDVVLFGATGFTGRIVAQYLDRVGAKQTPPLRWAVAGRSEPKLRQMATELSSAPEVLVATTTSQEQVDRVVSRARVLISTAGPFASYGTPVVDACVRLGCDYVDINGEVGWHRTMIDRYDAQACANGVRLVPSCGFDSVPSDLGVQWMAGLVTAACGAPARRITSYVAVRGSFSGGTVASGILSDETHGEPAPFLLGGAPAGGARKEDTDCTEAEVKPRALELRTNTLAPFAHPQPLAT